MSNNKIIFCLGLIIAAMPFLGFPSSWKTTFFVVAGIMLIFVTLRMYISMSTTERNIIDASDDA
jgi:uncharacterized membrane protein